jgi:hypothetical protein
MAESNDRWNGQMAGMAGIAEWQKEWQNGKMAEMDTPALADSMASTYVPLYVACRKTNPLLS